MQSLGARLKCTEQYCMFNIIAIHLGSSTTMPCMHTSLASQRVKGYHKNAHGNWQLSLHTGTLRVEKKPLSSHHHDRRKLANGLSEEGGGG